MVENPVPSVAAVLVLALPGIFLLGLTLARTASRDKAAADCMAPAIAIAVWILALHLSSRATHSFHSGLWIGTILPGLVGMVAYAYTRRINHSTGDSARPAAWMWLGALATVAIITPIALGWAFHDEMMFTGHMSMTSSIQNGPYPPRSLSMPAFELRYHYAFPLIVAAVTSMFRMPINLGIDIVTILAAGYLFILLWLLGDRILGAGKGWLTAVLTIFGGGVPFICAGGTDGLAPAMLGYCGVGRVSMNPPILSYLFQHPWTLGLPLAIALVLLGTEKRDAPARTGLMGLLLLALSLTQIVLFAAVSASLVVSETFARGFSLRRGLQMVALILIVWVAAINMGGFFAVSPTPRFPLSIHPGVLDGFIATLAWNAASFGMLLPFGLLGLAHTGPARILLLCFALGGLLVVNFVHYSHSWDIVKFGAVAAIGLSIAASAAVLRFRSIRNHRLRRAVTVAAFCGLTAGGFSFATAFLLDIDGIPEETFHKRASKYTMDEAQAMSWLRQRIRPGEIVLRNSGDPMSFAQWAGLPQPWYDPMLEPFGGGPAEQNERREALLAEMPDAPEAYRKEGISWFVVQFDNSRAARLADRWVDQGSAVERVRFGSLHVIELSTDKIEPTGDGRASSGDTTRGP